MSIIQSYESTVLNASKPTVCINQHNRNCYDASGLSKESLQPLTFNMNSSIVLLNCGVDHAQTYGVS